MEKSLPDGKEWEKLGLVLMGRAMLSKSLIQFSVDGQGCVPSLLFQFSTVQFSHSVVSNSLGLHGLQHARLPSPLPSPRVCWNSCPLSWWCHPTHPYYPLFLLSYHENVQDLLELTPKRGHFHLGELECKSRKSRDIWSNRQVWPWSTQSDQISHSVVSNSLRLHESQHVRPPCPSPTPGIHWDSRPSSQ